MTPFELSEIVVAVVGLVFLRVWRWRELRRTY